MFLIQIFKKKNNNKKLHYTLNDFSEGKNTTVLQYKALQKTQANQITDKKKTIKLVGSTIYRYNVLKVVLVRPVGVLNL